MRTLYVHVSMEQGKCRHGNNANARYFILYVVE